MGTITNRRPVISLGAGAAVCAAGGVGIAHADPLPGNAGDTISPELVALIAAEHAANNAAAEHDVTVLAPAHRQFELARDKALAAIPHTTVDAGLNFAGQPIRWSTSQPEIVAVTRTLVDMAGEGKAFDPQYIGAARQLQCAHLRRERARARAIDLARKVSGIQEANDANDALGTAHMNAQDAVTDFPARTAADLATKIACIIEWEREGVLDTLLADARRLAKMEG